MHLTAAQRGLDDVGGIHRSFGGTSAHNGVQLVDEENDVLGAANFVHDRLDAFLELAAILGAGHHQGEVQRDDAFLAQNFRHIALGNFLRQTFDDGGLAHARFAEEHGIVLGAAAENLNDALDFVLAPDDRIHFALAGDFRQVAAEGLQRGRFDFALFLRAFFGRRLRSAGAAFFLAGEIRIEFLQNFLAGLLDIHIEILQHARGHSVAFAQAGRAECARCRRRCG